MRILVLGGTYFLGKAFVDIACSEHDITILNRGTKQVSFSNPKHIQKIISDRHKLTPLCLTDPKYDLVIDFCAYEKGDIKQVIDALDGKISQYIFISTSDVYARGTGQTIKENSAMETKDYGGKAGSYILGKVALEKELQECCEAHQIHYTSIRPAFLYGPDNYAPREGIFFHWIEQAGQIIYPKDATGFFQMIYVTDAASIILKTCGNEKVFNQALNLCGPQKETYESFCNALAYAVGKEFTKVEVSIEEIEKKQIPLPFPLTAKESEFYESSLEKDLDIHYISLEEGLRKTYEKQKENELFEKIDALFDANKPKEAEVFMLDELQKAKEKGNSDVTLKLLNELIGYYRQTSEATPLLSVIQDSLSLIEHMGIQDTISYATTTLNVANAYRSLGKIDESQKYYEITESIYQNQILQGNLSPSDMLVAGLYNNISLMKQELSDYEAAENYLLKALEIVKKNNAGFEIAVTYANLANTAVLAKQYEKAAEYAKIAIIRFKARGLRDPHYCAALSALGTCYYEKGNWRRASAIFAEALQIVEETFGQNSQYKRLKENYEMCEKMIENTPRNGMELAKRYYETYGAKMIHEKFPDYEDKIAVGLSGEGSDCFGFDDEFSTDHDFGPDFCMWLSDETYDAIGQELQKAYDELPSEFAGYTRVITPAGQGRRGVIRISDYYRKFIGTAKYEEIDFTKIEDYSLAACVNGEIFKDSEGIFTAMRNRLLAGYPDDIRLLKIAQDAAGFSQCGQYNYKRMILRNDSLTAQMMLTDCMKHAMKLYHHILNQYPPHDKWLYKSTCQLKDSQEIIRLLDQINNKVFCGEDENAIANVIESLGEVFAMKLYQNGDISDIDSYLDHHTEELVFKASAMKYSNDELINKIVRLEFEAFDKVKNEGGRASCQNDWPTFFVMRKSQYLTWNREMLIQYYYDFTREYRNGHNLITEKYGRMMESTAPEKYAELKEHFPAISDEKKAIIEQIVKIQMEMVEAFSVIHPKTVMNARSLHTSEDNIMNTSYETYLRGEISTYSDKMLQLYAYYVVNAAQKKENIAYMTMENTAKLYGFKDLDEFEK